MTMINRCCTNAPPKFALTDIEIKILDQVVKDDQSKELSNYLIKIARLGGYLNRASDPPPGNTIMWRGLARLVDIQLGFNLAVKIVGN